MAKSAAELPKLNMTQNISSSDLKVPEVRSLKTLDQPDTGATDALERRQSGAGKGLLPLTHIQSQPILSPIPEKSIVKKIPTKTRNLPQVLHNSLDDYKRDQFVENEYAKLMQQPLDRIGASLQNSV